MLVHIFHNYMYLLDEQCIKKLVGSIIISLGYDFRSEKSLFKDKKTLKILIYFAKTACQKCSVIKQKQNAINFGDNKILYFYFCLYFLDWKELQHFLKH